MNTETNRRHHRARLEIVVAGGIIAVCLAAWLDLQGVPAEAVAFPELVLAILTFLCAVIAIRAGLRIRTDRADEKAAEWTFFVNWKLLAVTLALLAGFVLTFETVGFFGAAAVFLVALTAALGFWRPRLIAVTYVLFLLFIYVVFIAVFDRPLPLDVWLGG